MPIEWRPSRSAAASASPARAGAYFSSAPFLGAVFAIALLGQPITRALAAVAVLMGLGTICS